MKMKRIRQKAEELGLDSDNLKKRELIQAIQVAENNFPCFRTGQDSCNQVNCCWRDDCLSPGWRKGARLEQVKEELEGLMKNIDELKAKTKILVGQNKNDVLKEFKKIEKQGEKEIMSTIQTLGEASEKAWKNTRKGLDNSWEDIAGALKKLTARF
ncbi:hypothetical protein VU01_13103 [Candidatus Electrothrix marina]|uniref:Rho termination factor, N-terminal domain n=1 Tax=Candidatus Electrothrix marina TaxID=1859130 RepID=A0A444JBP5_9BACT|nr:hypothetical protein VT99_13802 [Candidatus Electrothrix marina]RWX50494.1 hypothetical protein VU01_13103 [Candidatus Electrothrix marina]